MKITKTKLTIGVLSTIIFILIITNIFVANIAQQNKFQTGFRLNGSVTVKILSPNGETVSQTRNDTITNLSYDYIACLLWNSGCGSFSGSANNLIFRQMFTYTTTATISSIYPANTVLIAIALSSGTQTSSVCQNVISTNGLNQTTASVSHSSQQNSPVVTLTDSFTFSGSSQAVQSICLLPGTSNLLVSSFPNTPSEGSVNPTDFAWENFSTQTLTTGQSISITWTFSM